ADVFFKAQGDAYLGTQGDVWDAQKDIMLAFSGALLATTIVTVGKKVFNIYEEKYVTFFLNPGNAKAALRQIFLYRFLGLIPNFIN
ncbi:MAG: DUF2238 domain-containing protein, partial [Bacteroidia bacterium]